MLLVHPAAYRISKYHGIITWYYLLTMLSSQYFFVREIEQMNYFGSAYPEVVKGEVGQSHAGDVFRELLQDLRVLCLQVDKKETL